MRKSVFILSIYTFLLQGCTSSNILEYKHPNLQSDALSELEIKTNSKFATGFNTFKDQINCRIPIVRSIVRRNVGFTGIAPNEIFVMKPEKGKAFSLKFNATSSDKDQRRFAECSSIITFVPQVEHYRATYITAHEKEFITKCGISFEQYINNKWEPVDATKFINRKSTQPFFDDGAWAEPLTEAQIKSFLE